MKLAIIGGTGFLGSYFLESYSAQFTQVNGLSRNRNAFEKFNFRPTKIVEGNLGDEVSVSELLRGMDILVHAGFDHDYEENVRGMENIVRAISQEYNTVKRVVYLSSYVVYDQEQKEITEQSPRSNYGDIYTKEKLSIEKLIRESASPAEFVILQPTIVLGRGGNWSKVLIEATNSKVVKLARRGESTCNYVYVKDVADAIYQATVAPSQILPSAVASFLITGGTASWRNVLLSHAGIATQSGQSHPSLPEIEQTYCGTYGNSWLENLTIGTLYSPVFRSIAGPVLKFIKQKINGRKSVNQVPGQPVKEYSFKGLSKAIQEAECVVNDDRASSILGYMASYGLSELAADMCNNSMARPDRASH